MYCYSVKKEFHPEVGVNESRKMTETNKFQ